MSNEQSVCLLRELQMAHLVNYPDKGDELRNRMVERRGSYGQLLCRIVDCPVAPVVRAEDQHFLPEVVDSVGLARINCIKS